tara:strand:+ start:7285 stop:8082 length:798 start_codon:yes stop_codon:yes gene_type:complete
MSLTGKSPSETYKDLTYVDNNNSGVDSTTRSVKTGNGSETSLSLSDRAVKIKSSTDNTTALDVQNSSGTSKLLVDTTNSQVKALGTHVNTQYAYFGISENRNTGNAAGYHYPLIFGGFAEHGTVNLFDQEPNFGNGADPATTFTTADATDQRADNLIKHLMLVPDNMVIDAVHSLEGASGATGDTTRMHLMSYTFTSGSTSCLTGGTLIAHNSDVTNAGAEQVYQSEWTIDSSSVSAGKILMAFFESDSVNSDYTYRTIIKYHLI